MKSSWFRISSYLQYLSKRRTIQYIHPPFLFSLMGKVLKDSPSKNDPVFKKIEAERKALLSSRQVLRFTDHGAGGDLEKEKDLPVHQLAARSLKEAKYARLLYRLVQHSGAENIVELGTSLGITTAYMAAANPSAHVYTVEGDAGVQNIARETWKKIGSNNIHSFHFDLNEHLTSLYQTIGRIDLLFVDANHRGEAMLRYVMQALPFMHAGSVVVLDDIFWNEDTLMGWGKMKAWSNVTLSFDIFQAGFLFFNPDLSKQDFRLKY